ncbi:cobalt-factor II C(20)-methyltransferase [Natronomonas salsuginis]|uniref:Cobalt-factor II C(20)-methyltransferase n=1 Tax=Natronomonas salsuginis TaxID=2217661 RepID=A0A4V5ZNJ7_9EURY|nr:cobalt-factor II C(20)-methyltransferase [Natronomonas salsuginis]TKR25513.1 cobalt-factor II C(20)-methyltransferase [Natronomonas salsuginis]
MTLYGVGLGPGDAGLITVQGRETLENADVVYAPGRLSRGVATEYVSEDQLGDLDFPMTRDEDELRRAWKAAAGEVAPAARDGTAAFVTLGDPNVYSTFGHLRRTLDRFHPDVDVETVPGVSTVTAFATAFGVEITAGSELVLREAARGAAPVGPDRLVLFKVTDVPATHETLVEAGYEVTYGRRLFMHGHESIVTDDPAELAERDYYTVAYAEKPDAGRTPATAAFGEETTADGGERTCRTAGPRSSLDANASSAGPILDQLAAAESAGDGEAYRSGGDR